LTLAQVATVAPTTLPPTTATPVTTPVPAPVPIPVPVPAPVPAQVPPTTPPPVGSITTSFPTSTDVPINVKPLGRNTTLPGFISPGANYVTIHKRRHPYFRRMARYAVEDARFRVPLWYGFSQTLHRWLCCDRLRFVWHMECDGLWPAPWLSQWSFDFRLLWQLDCCTTSPIIYSVYQVCL
jgi:hypothetical protein